MSAVQTPRVKICGLSRREDIAAANELLPDYVGFVFAPTSKRYISYEQASVLKLMLDTRIQAVGVFVDADKDEVIHALQTGIIDIAQLHGSEDDAYIQYVQQQSGKPVIKAVVVSTTEDVVHACDSKADYILLDSGAGSGKTFDWDILRAATRPYFLAGGLHEGNILEALAHTNAFALDMSSGVETDGVKDKIKIQNVLQSVRNTKGVNNAK